MYTDLTTTPTTRPDLDHIASIIGDHCAALERLGASVKVLDVGCGSGILLDIISSSRTNVIAKGIELSQDDLNTCVLKKYQIVQGDADKVLETYVGVDCYDWVILSHLIQYVRDPRHVMRCAVEIGRSVIVSFYNVAYWRNRASFALLGHIPAIPPSRPSDCDSGCKMLSVLDFEALCDALGIIVQGKTVLDPRGREIRREYLHNVLGYQAIYVMSDSGGVRNVRT